MTHESPHILGLDIGTNSVGWALLETDSKGKPRGIISIGARVFPAGVQGDIESGRDVSRAVDRRTARLRRRMLDRRTRRLAKLAKLLQSAGMLPEGDLSTGESRHTFFLSLDKDLFPQVPRKQAPHTLLYGLRARALDGKLSLHELGRALYHLAQRRGFLSNRTVSAGDEEETKKREEGKVKEAISKLGQEMRTAGTRTIGEYLSRLDPEKERIRQRWTSRQMYLDEFGAIWEAQRAHHPEVLLAAFRKSVHRAIFFQRPLKWDRSTIGTCELEPGRPRAPLALLEAQRFRLLQKVNDLRLLPDEETGEIWASGRLDEDRRAKLIKVLEEQGDLAFSKFPKLLALPKWVGYNFKKEYGEAKLIGNRTASKLHAVFGDRWARMTTQERDLVVEDLRSIRSETALKTRAQRQWKLDEESAIAFSKIALEEGHCALSRQAIKKLLPLMERGKPLATAQKELYGDRPTPQPLAALPSLDKAPIPPIRNPAVLRTLSEVRKVVNGVIREYGKPACIRVELARDLKRGRKERQAIWKENQASRKKREQAAQKLLQECGITKPSRRDLEKWLLADECGWRCPYTGLTISGDSLFGPTPQFDVEHIIPFSRLLDDSFLNKTLCHMDENRHVKMNRTPWEAYGQDRERWQEILQRVREFTGRARTLKLERFQLEGLDSLDEFTNNQLSDTRYISRQAVEYLALLYGTGAQGVDADHTRRVQVGRGSVTQYLRDEWGLNRILGDGGAKPRHDHRHHAVDALCIALTSPATVKMLSDAAARAVHEGRHRFGRVEPPWPGFYASANESIRKIVVSHRPAHKVSGPLHEETFYGRPKNGPPGHTEMHVRKPLGKLSKNEVASIVDLAVRDIVSATLNGRDPKQVFADASSHPKMASGVPIHGVRIAKSERTQAVGRDGRERQVITGSNHHLEVIETKDPKDRVRWEGRLVTMLEAMRRVQSGEPVVQREHGEGKRFLFSLCPGDPIEVRETGVDRLFVVRTVYADCDNGGTVEFKEIEDAREVKEIKASGRNRKKNLEPLRKLNCRKVSVSPLGVVRYAHD